MITYVAEGEHVPLLFEQKAFCRTCLEHRADTVQAVPAREHQLHMDHEMSTMSMNSSVRSGCAPTHRHHVKLYLRKQTLCPRDLHGIERDLHPQLCLSTHHNVGNPQEKRRLSPHHLNHQNNARNGSRTHASGCVDGQTVIYPLIYAV